MLSEFYKFNNMKKPVEKKPEIKEQKTIDSESENQNKNDNNNNKKDKTPGYDELRNIDLEIQKEAQTISLAEQIKMRNEQDKKNKHKDEIIKELHKSKKINLEKFLTRSLNYEQKKRYNIEMQKVKKLQNERETLLDKPILSRKTYEICKNKNQNQPIYLRANKILEERKEEIENLYKISMLPKSVLDTQKSRNAKFRYVKNMNHSMDSINEKKPEEINTQKKTTKEMNDFYFNQEQWFEKTQIKIKINEKMLQNRKNKKNGATFHPLLSKGTKEIIASKYYNDSQLTETTINKNNKNNSMEYDESVFDKLYNEGMIKDAKLQLIQDQYAYDFTPYTNKNKFRNIPSRYYNIPINKKKKKKIKKIVNKSVNNYDNVNIYSKLNQKNNDISFSNNSPQIKSRNKSDLFKDSIDNTKTTDFSGQNWTKSLLKMEQNENNKIPNDKTYHLNVMSSGAWNENVINKVTLNANTRNVINNVMK